MVLLHTTLATNHMVATAAGLRGHGAQGCVRDLRQQRLGRWCLRLRKCRSCGLVRTALERHVLEPGVIHSGQPG